MYIYQLTFIYLAWTFASYDHKPTEKFCKKVYYIVVSQKYVLDTSLLFQLVESIYVLCMQL